MSDNQVPQEVLELMTNLVVPCRHFQIHPTGLNIPYGFCWKRQIETRFQGPACKGCESFSCGLFDPTAVMLPKGPKGWMLEYDRENSQFKLGVQGEFGWLAWQRFKDRVISWQRTSTGQGLKPGTSKATGFLMTSAEGLPWHDRGLPPAEGGETVFGYFLRNYPARRSQRVCSIIENFKSIVEAALKDPEQLFEVGMPTVIAKAIELRKAGKTPDDLK